MKVYFTALCLCVASVPFLAVSQQPAYHWYFGNEAGLDFSSGTATAVTDGQLMTYDNSAVVSDGSGDLLFYTNGVTVWNASHAVMLNGTGLMGHLTSQHSATAFTVGSMESQHTHYIFTVDAFSGSNGLRYSTVDMALDGGNGGVALKNVPLATDVTEKVLAIRHANGVDVWLIAHGIGNNEFYAWEVNASGISS